MPNRSLPLLLLMVGACVAGFMGYHRGFETAVEKPVVGKSLTSDRREEQRETRPDQMSRLRALGGRADRSHSAMIESWRIIRNFSADEIRQALADMSQSQEKTKSGRQLTAMLHCRWAEIDPEAALESAIQSDAPFLNATVLNAALTAWMNRDPEAAYRWAKSKPEIADKANLYNRMMARTLSSETPSGALDKASAEGEEMRKSVSAILATNMSATPEGRAAFLAELAKRGPDELAAGKIQLLTSWGRDDPKGALEGIADLGLDPQRASTRREAIMSSWSRLDPASALAWMAGKPDALPLAKRTQVFTTWTRESPDEALKHFAFLGNEPGFGEAVMNSLMLENGKASLNPNSGGAPWIELNRSTLQACYQRWMAQAPEAASRWQESLDPDLKKELQPTASHESH